jgi:hypothetical protein
VAVFAPTLKGLGAVLSAQFHIEPVLALSEGTVAEVQPLFDFFVEQPLFKTSEQLLARMGERARADARPLQGDWRANASLSVIVSPWSGIVLSVSRGADSFHGIASWESGTVMTAVLGTPTLRTRLRAACRLKPLGTHSTVFICYYCIGATQTVRAIARPTPLR